MKTGHVIKRLNHEPKLLQKYGKILNEQEKVITAPIHYIISKMERIDIRVSIEIHTDAFVVF